MANENDELPVTPKEQQFLAKLQGDVLPTEQAEQPAPTTPSTPLAQKIEQQADYADAVKAANAPPPKPFDEELADALKGMENDTTGDMSKVVIGSPGWEKGVASPPPALEQPAQATPAQPPTPQDRVKQRSAQRRADRKQRIQERDQPSQPATPSYFPPDMAAPDAAMGQPPYDVPLGNVPPTPPEPKPGDPSPEQLRKMRLGLPAPPDQQFRFSGFNDTGQTDIPTATPGAPSGTNHTNQQQAVNFAEMFRMVEEIYRKVQDLDTDNGGLT